MLAIAKDAGWEATAKDDHVTITVTDGVSAQTVLAKATEAGLEVSDIQTGKTNLEDHLLEVLSTDATRV